MKQIIAFVFLSILLVGCSKVYSIEAIENNSSSELSETDALEAFAEVLSKAVYESEELREFLKDEALKQYDKDYDVFYPFVKEHIFPSGESLHSLLSGYTKESVGLDEIERSVPKLTVLIPDFSWIDAQCFNVMNWDTSLDNVCVGYDDKDVSHKIFHNGAFLGVLSAASIPAFPVLIVKSNERMKASPSLSKARAYTYTFADQAFDGTLIQSSDTKGHREGYLENEHTEQRKDLFSDTGNFIAYNELNTISPASVGAYNEFGTGYLGAAQRDYIFYGMTTSNTDNGVLNNYMRDLLYRIRFTPAALFNMSDYSDDPGLATLHTGRDDRPGFDEALARIWGNGNYEIRVTYYQDANNGGAGSIGSNVLSIAPSEIMYVTRCYSTFDWNFWGNNWSSYTIYSADIEPKWYYPGDKNTPLPMVNTAWNLATASDNIWIKVSEYDPSSTETYTYTASFKQSFSVSFTNSVWKKIGLGVSGSYGTEGTNTESVSVTRTLGSDDLGDCWHNYVDNVITSSSTQNNVSGYQLKSIGNAYFAMSFIPIDTRNEYQIQQFLLGRKYR